MSEYRQLKLITAPAVEVWTVAELLANAEYFKTVDFADEETAAYFTDTLIPAARHDAEATLDRKFITQTWEMTFDGQPSIIKFPFGQLQSVTSVITVAEDDTETTETSSNYSVQTGDYGRLWLRSGSAWTTTTRMRGLMKVQFVCGYGDASTDVPHSIRMSLMSLMLAMYENRLPNYHKIRADLNLSPERIWGHV